MVLKPRFLQNYVWRTVRSCGGLTEDVLEKRVEAELDKKGSLNIDLAALIETKLQWIS